MLLGLIWLVTMLKRFQIETFENVDSPSDHNWKYKFNVMDFILKVAQKVE
jgi:hypothetical protein